MNKMNKKGFTLIEMLVVIAIIAVLVSIIIPTVSSATTKAAAATNAANLRAFKAQLVTASLAGEVTSTTTDGVVTYSDGVNTFTAPIAKGFTFMKDGTAVTIAENAATATRVTTGEGDNAVETDDWDVKFGDYTIDDFAKIAEDGKLTTNNSESK